LNVHRKFTDHLTKARSIISKSQEPSNFRSKINNNKLKSMYQNVCDQEKNLTKQFNNLLQHKTKRLYNEYNLESNLNRTINSNQQNGYRTVETSMMNDCSMEQEEPKAGVKCLHLTND
jgi:hypothetical protein